MSTSRVFAILLAAASLLPSGVRGGTPPEGWLANHPRFNVLLITLDTTRADHLGSYGDHDALTPALDALATGGTLFEQAFTSCPMTLPAHATILTGLEPPEHGLRVNGRNSLAATVPTLAETLADHGYQTGAFVAAFVLNSRFGLNRGFQTYDDDLAGAWKQAVPEPLSVYRPGDRVTDAALDWLDRAVATTGARPFFAWVHLYDPHYPYHVHAELAGTPFEGAASYDAEVAFMDRQVGRLTGFLAQRHLAETTLVIAVGDHGEGLGDHGEPEHGYLLNEEVLRVPLLVSLPGVVREGLRVSAVVSLVDLVPTILDVLEIPHEPRGRGRSLRAGLRGEGLPSLPSYAETDLPYTLFGWSPLRSLTTTRWKYVRTARPELYDRDTDAKEVHNLFSTRHEQARPLEAKLAAIETKRQARAAPAIPLDADARRRLGALGYVADGGAVPPTSSSRSLKDVKDMLPVKHLGTQLINGMSTQSLSQAEILDLARELVRQSPESAPFQYRLGSALVTAGKLDEAIEHLTEALRIQPDLADARTNLGHAFVQLGKLDEGVREYTEAVHLSPDLPEAHLGLGNALTARGALKEALQHYAEAVRLRPDYVDAHLNLANALARRGEGKQAIAHYREALRIKPDFALAHHDLATVLARRADVGEALAHAREAVRLAPDFAAAQYNLGKLLAEEGQLREAIEHYTEAVRLRPGEPEFEDNLAAAYAAAGRFTDAVTAARKALELAQAGARPELASDIARRMAFYERRGGRRAQRQPRS